MESLPKITNEYTILVPTAFNDGTEIPPGILADIRTRALDLFGGLTIAAPVRGLWQHPDGHLCDETMVPFLVATEHPYAVTLFAETVAALCHQEAVYTARSAFNVQFISQHPRLTNNEDPSTAHVHPSLSLFAP
jgi:hypothetical protein